MGIWFEIWQGFGGDLAGIWLEIWQGFGGNLMGIWQGFGGKLGGGFVGDLAKDSVRIWWTCSHSIVMVF